MDVIYQGADWWREVSFSDGTNPVDPDDLSAVLCPATPLTVTAVVPGTYRVSLTDLETAALAQTYRTHWEVWGTVGSDRIPLVRRAATVEATCGGTEPAP